MSDPTDLSAFGAVAAPVIQKAAARLTRRLGLRLCDREDLEQELWLHLLMWRRDGRSGGFRDDEPTALHEEISCRVRRLVNIFVRSCAFRRRFGSRRELSSSHWLDNGLAANRSTDAHRLYELRLDVAVVLTRLPDDLREPCEHLLAGASLQSSFPPDDPLAHLTAAAVRRAFRMHHLNDYL